MPLIPTTVDITELVGGGSVDLAYGVIRFIAPTSIDPGSNPACPFQGTNSATGKAYTIADSMTAVASHEYAEMATDPAADNTGWSQGPGTNETEIGDLCNREPATYSPVTFAGPSTVPSSVVQLLWSNANNDCVSSYGNQYISPAVPGQHTVQGAILGEYINVGQNGSVIGPPISEETTIGVGRVSYFTGGCATNYPQGNCAAIYWSSGSGAHYVRGGEYQEYVKRGEAASVIGFPVTDDAAIGNGGSVTYFNGTCGGSTECAGIYWSGSTGSHFVRASEFTEYQRVHEANGPLGFPVSDDTGIPGGSATYFSGNDACGTPGPAGSDGAIYWSGATNSHEVHGCIYAFYQTHISDDSQKPIASVLGFPLSDETGITDYYGTSGRVNYFTANAACGSPGPAGSDGAIYWTGSHAYEVHGCIYGTYYTQWGGPSGVLGFPISSEFINAAGQYESDFQGGSIIWENGTGVVTLNCLGAHKCS